MRRVAQGLVRYRRVLFILSILLAAVAYPLSLRITGSKSIDALFAPGDPRLEQFSASARDFGGEETCLAVYGDDELLTAAGMVRLRQLTAQFEEVDGILDATSLAELPRPKRAYQPRKLEEWFGDPSVNVETLRQEILECEMYRDLFVGDGGKTAAIVLQVDRTILKNNGFDQTLATMRALAASQPFDVQLVGAPILIHDVYGSLAQDGFILTTVSSAVMLLVIWLLFGSVRWIILPALIVIVSVLWTRGTMGALGIDLSIIGSMTSALITVIGIATVIHIAVRFLEEKEQRATPEEALVETLIAVLPPIFWTCMTTAAGFGSLGVSHVLPVRNYALVMSLASLFVGLATFSLVPAGILSFGSLGSAPRHAPGEEGLARALHRLLYWVCRHSILTSLALLLLMAVAAAGLQRLRIETNFTRNFREESPILQGYQFVEARLGGGGLIEVTFPTPQPLSEQFLDQIRATEAELRQLSGITKVVGIVDVLDFLYQSVPAADTMALARFISIGQKDQLLRFQLDLLRLVDRRNIGSFWNQENGRMRLLLRVREQQEMGSKTELIDRIGTITQDKLQQPVEVTGLFVLMVFLVDSLLGDQWTSFAASSFAIMILLSIALRSVRLGLVGFIPNLVPIAAVIGFMGWLGWPVNVATAMIGSISMGLVVDFSIHYLFRFRDQRKAGVPFAEALDRTQRSTGKAMVFANLALVLGFGVLTFSHFVPTVHFGLLVSVAILGGLIGNLTTLPLLLRAVHGFPKWEIGADSSDKSD